MTMNKKLINISYTRFIPLSATNYLINRVVPEAIKVTMMKQPNKSTRQDLQQGFNTLMAWGMRCCSSLADGENCVPLT